MAKVAGSHSDMAQARQSDGINVIFDQNSPATSRSRSRSRSSHGSGSSSVSVSHRGRASHRRRYRSPSSSTSSPSRSRSSSRNRSRSHPRCHRPSSRCRCDGHHRYVRGRYRRSPPRRYRAHSRSYSPSPSSDRYSHRRSNKSRSRSSGRQNQSRREISRYRSKPSQPSSRADRSHSKSRSGSSASLSVDDKRELLKAAQTNAMKTLGTEKLELPESVKPVLPEPFVESRSPSPEPVLRVRQDPDKTMSQSDEEEPDELSSVKMSPKRKIISFSINNSVAKPAAAATSGAKVTPRVDSYESRKPYGHWVPVRSGRTSKTHRRSATLR
ncbi:uncharacterized protein V6R79_015446 [Siganus canaliculatus]